MRSGSEYRSGLRDGRAVYVDGARVEDVTEHPAFSGAVRSIASLYDTALDPEHGEDLSWHAPELGGEVNVAFMIPRSEEDLVRRRRGLTACAEQTFGLMGRSPDHVAGFLAGFAAAPDVFARGGAQFADNVQRFHRFAAANDIYAAYTIVPPQIDRSKPAHEQEQPFLYAGVKEERDDGIVVQGAQMLGTGAAIADWIHLSTIVPLRPGDEAHAISAMVPVAADGVKLICRRSYAQGATSAFDYPLSSRFDEIDALVVFDEVFVPWENVFVYRDLDLVQAQWWETPAWLYGNVQAQVRLAVKLEFLAGVASRVAGMNGVEALPPVQGALGDLAAHAAMTRALVVASEQECEIDASGVAWPGRDEIFAGSALHPDLHSHLLDIVRDLCGGGLIQLPSSEGDFELPELAEQIERYIRSPGVSSRERVQLLKLAWDLVGSEFAGRNHQYELFYAGAPFVTKMRMARTFDFARAGRLVDTALAEPQPEEPAGALES